MLNRPSMENYLSKAVFVFTCLSMLGAGIAREAAAKPLQAAALPAPLVELDARDSSAGTDVWMNRGTLGAFNRIGKPKAITIAGAQAVQFDGRSDAYLGPRTNSDLEGRHPRTIEVWVYNPAVDSGEETMVSWGNRGGAAGSMLAFGYGASGGYGAATHWADDLGWDGVPQPGQWHHLVYTYNGVTAKIYQDAAEKNSRDTTLNTEPTTISLAAEAGADGKLQFTNEYDHTQQAGSLSLATVRIFGTALTQKQIEAEFNRDAARFAAKKLPFPGALLDDGFNTVSAGGLRLSLVRATQSPASLVPTGDTFDFLPSDSLKRRMSDRCVHLGDVTIRVRTPHGDWMNLNSSTHRMRLAPIKLAGALAACDLTPSLGKASPLQVIREWRKEGNELVLRYRLRNRSNTFIEVGAFGAAMAFNNLLSGRRIEEAYAKCSFADPAINGPAGYLQVTRLKGVGSALLVLPERGTSFEAYRQLKEDPTPRDVTFEGFYEWMTNTAAYAGGEWKGVNPWCSPSSFTLRPGETAIRGFRFVLAPNIRNIETTLLAHKQPVAVGIPGYQVATDAPARLFLHVGSGIKSDVRLKIEPSGALSATKSSVTPHGWIGFTITGKQPGRCRVTAIYADGMRQEISYNVIRPERDLVARLGRFHSEKQWFTDESDPFGRAYSFMPVDRDTGKMVLQHSHTWMSGLSDEMGAGPSVAMAMKNLEQPDAAEIEKLEK